MDKNKRNTNPGSAPSSKSQPIVLANVTPAPAQAQLVALSPAVAVTPVVPATNGRPPLPEDKVIELINAKAPLEYQFVEAVLTKSLAMAIKAHDDPERNRARNKDRVRMLAYQMGGGFWIGRTGEVLKFGKSGKLIDGGHREDAYLAAVEKSPSLTIPVTIALGVEDVAQTVMDRGQSRSLVQDLRLRKDEEGARASAYLKLCARLAAGRPVPLRPLALFDAWLAIFKANVVWALGVFGKRRGGFSAASVAGALAFAHHADPAGIATFGTQEFATGVGLNADDPALVIRAELGGKHTVPTGEAGIRVVRQVLNAALAHLHKRPIKKVDSSNVGLVAFRRAWKGDTKLEELAAPWSTEGNSLADLEPLPAGGITSPDLEPK